VDAREPLPAAPSEADRTTLVLELAPGRGASLVGRISRLGAQQGVCFHGWIALMQAIDQLRGPAPPERPAGDTDVA
jgi:hypothetical protein